MVTCEFATSTLSEDSLLKPSASVTLVPGPGIADDHEPPKPDVETYIALCRGTPTDFARLKVTVSQPDHCAFHCRGKKHEPCTCEMYDAPDGHEWKREVPPAGNEYKFDVRLCMKEDGSYGVLRMNVREDLSESLRCLAMEWHDDDDDDFVRTQDLEITLRRT